MPYPSSWSDKDIRMIGHIEASGASKSEAAATVNKFKSKHGTTKKQKAAKAKRRH